MKKKTYFEIVRPFLFIGAWIALAFIVYGIAGGREQMLTIGIISGLAVFTAAVVAENMDHHSKNFQ